MAIEISLCMAVWSTSHLLRRSIETIANQTIAPDRYEVIIIDDNSPDDVAGAVKGFGDRINLKVVKLEHDYGMRGNTVSFNTAFDMARGQILAETTPECLLPRDALERMLVPHYRNKRAFVALKVYPIQPQMQLEIDSVDWRGNIMNVSSLDGWDAPIVQHNVPITHFGTHQICSIGKDVFFEITDGRGFPLFGDYGCLDGSTKILTADMRWVRNDSLSVGDILVGVTETPAYRTKRKLELSSVLRIGEVKKKSFRIITDDGRDIIASEEHPWLVANASEDGQRRTANWVRTDCLVAGDQIRKLLDVNVEMVSSHAEKLAYRWIGVGLPVKRGDVVSRIIRIEPLGMRNLIGMTTSTKTFIAEGLVSHNSEDPWYSGQRPKRGVIDITLPNDCMAIHQWHPPFQYWMSKGYAPMLNKWAHSMANYMGDTSGHVPDGGTCEIWDKGSHDVLSDADRENWKQWDDVVIRTGARPSAVYASAVYGGQNV